MMAGARNIMFMNTQIEAMFSENENYGPILFSRVHFIYVQTHI